MELGILRENISFTKQFGSLISSRGRVDSEHNQLLYVTFNRQKHVKFNYASIYQVEGTPRFKADLNEIDEREDRTEERDSGVQKVLEEEEEEEDLASRREGGRRAELTEWHVGRWMHKSLKDVVKIVSERNRIWQNSGD